MNFAMILWVAFRALVRNKVRSFLTMLGIIVGIAAVIAVVAVGEGAHVMIQDQIRSMGNNLLVIFPGTSHFGGRMGGAGTQRTLTAEDGKAILNEVPYVVALTPLVRTGRQVIYQENNWSTHIQGVDPNYLSVRNLELAQGGFFTESEVLTAARVCVLGQTVVKNLFTDTDPIDQTIRIQNIPFRVIGVFQPKGSTAWGQDQDDTVVAPWTTIRRVLQNSPFADVDQLLATLDSMDHMEPAQEEIRAILRQRHHLAPDADDDFTIMDMTEVTKTITQVSQVMTILLTVIASISLLVGGIGIMNIMLVSVTERTREIGLRMAVGARRQDILMQFLVEAVALAASGGLIGIALGMILAQVVGRTNGWPVLVSPGSILIALLFSAAVGIFFGFYPAWRASRLDPIETLRYE
ncbi:MAG: multidrug ABC transporter substrate-binding protein [Deltaproteobacteria bacterium RBG_13_61_14]|nr:MAG: multidrug ABC transporter substrate-binding protein [Deltaproteobacteria bacterium RBG_13_61_14]